MTATQHNNNHMKILTETTEQERGRESSDALSFAGRGGLVLHQQKRVF